MGIVNNSNIIIFFIVLIFGFKMYIFEMFYKDSPRLHSENFFASPDGEYRGGF
jgi:hypothetical protein